MIIAVSPLIGKETPQPAKTLKPSRQSAEVIDLSLDDDNASSIDVGLEPNNFQIKTEPSGTSYSLILQWHFCLKVAVCVSNDFV